MVRNVNHKEFMTCWCYEWRTLCVSYFFRALMHLPHNREFGCEGFQCIFFMPRLCTNTAWSRHSNPYKRLQVVSYHIQKSIRYPWPYLSKIYARHNCTKKVGPSDKFHSNTVFCICDQIGCFFLLHIWYNHMLIPSASRHSQSYLPPKLQNASEKKIVWTWNLPWKGGDAPGATLNMSVQVLINFHFVEKKHYIIKMFLLLMLPCPLRHLDVVEVYCVPCAPYFVAFVSVRSYKSG